MKALVKARAERGIWMEDIDLPRVGHNDVLIKVHKTAICGTDIHIYQWDDWAQHTIPVPLAVGHEFSGEIVECGIEVRGFSPGDRVSAEGHITCGVCRNCRAGRRHLCINTVGVGVNRPGAFAERVEDRSHVIGDGVRELEDVEGGDGDVLGERAGAVDADADGVYAQVTAS
ncbi:MAG: alcohol dehydrogenase catalytic domain-containing protein, partial [Pseudomonadota bacterium]